jgi:hypothetical protein
VNAAAPAIDNTVTGTAPNITNFERTDITMGKTPKRRNGQKEFFARFFTSHHRSCN